MRWALGRARRLGAVALLALGLIGAGCASGDPRLARSAQADGWERCDPAPRTAFTLLCYRR